MKISPHFHREEFACKCGCGMDTVDAELLEMLEDVRFHFNSPVTINSANRCIDHNKKCGGSTNSQHLRSRAADINVANVHSEDVYNYLDLRYSQCGLGLYDSFVHVDSRGNKARWDNRSKT